MLGVVRTSCNTDFPQALWPGKYSATPEGKNELEIGQIGSRILANSGAEKGLQGNRCGNSECQITRCPEYILCLRCPEYEYLDNGHSHQVPTGGTYYGSTGNAQIQAAGDSAQTENILIQTETGFADLSDPVNSRHGQETRPRNVALLYCIKF
jgi:hypothetical protein